MDREILFRGKRTDNGEWVLGLLARYNSNFETANMVNELGILIPVLSSTVGQYTGLTDKNGKKIFEGDIVILRFNPCVVKWDSDNACYALYQNSITKVSGFNADTMKLLEVIGNIHDNPELIKQEG